MGQGVGRAVLRPRSPAASAAARRPARASRTAVPRSRGGERTCRRFVRRRRSPSRISGCADMCRRDRRATRTVCGAFGAGARGGASEGPRQAASQGPGVEAGYADVVCVDDARQVPAHGACPRPGTGRPRQLPVRSGTPVTGEDARPTAAPARDPIREAGAHLPSGPPSRGPRFRPRARPSASPRTLLPRHPLTFAAPTRGAPGPVPPGRRARGAPAGPSGSASTTGAAGRGDPRAPPSPR